MPFPDIVEAIFGDLYTNNKQGVKATATVIFIFFMILGLYYFVGSNSLTDLSLGQRLRRTIFILLVGLLVQYLVLKNKYSF